MSKNHLIENITEAEKRASQGQKIIAVFARMDHAERAMRSLLHPENSCKGQFKQGHGVRYDNGGCLLYFGLAVGSEAVRGLEINGYFIDPYCMEFDPRKTFEFEVALKQLTRH